MIEKIIVLGGKGGVGKSSISAATAVILSDLLPEKKFLLISFDMAHNLSDLLSKDIGNIITPITSNLWAIEPDANEYAEIYTKDLVQKMKTLMKQMPLVGMIPQIEGFIDTTFTSDSIPLALKNAMFFQKILDAEDINSQEVQYDIIIADFPPTANMITLFEIPEDQIKVVLKYSLNFYNSIKGAMRNFSKMFRQILKPFNDDYEKRKELGKEIFNMIVDLEKRGERITELIHTVGSLRLVSIAEKPSYEEVKRARDLTEKYINLEAIHINMLTPDPKHCNFCEKMRQIQLKFSAEIKKEFKNLKIWESNKLLEEPIGLDGLRKLALEIYKDCSVEEILNP
ncbi:MAG: TRC40/GET3/ArsA family transport-energizing ATPase [Candidatus Lokiarchaeota archaeon]|nr:TRC40/GET3/ArsA family transport-energizing ATPase [Candidatus Lokiarchaeota archaeon]